MRPPGVARALGSCARAPPPDAAAPELARERAEPESCGLTKRPDARRRVAGAQGSERPFSLPCDRATGARATRTRGPGPAPKVCVRGTPCAPTWRTWYLPATTGGLARSGAWGYLHAPFLPKWQGGLGETTPQLRVRPHSPAPFCLSLDCCLEPCAPPPCLSAVGIVYGSAACGSRAPRYWGGVLKPPS